MIENDTAGEAMRRLCIGVDLKGYHELDTTDQHEAQKALAKVLAEAADATKVQRVDWSTQPGGDGELALLPPGVDEEAFVHMFVRALHKGLHLHNRRRLPRLRVRLALHQGIARLSESGWAGDAVVTVMRLCDAQEAKQVLIGEPSASLVVIISQQLFADVIGDQDSDLNRNSFAPVRIDIPNKAFRADAWVCSPQVEVTRLEELMRPEEPQNLEPPGQGSAARAPVSIADRPSTAAGRDAVSAGENGVIAGRDAAGRDFHRDSPGFGATSR